MMRLIKIGEGQALIDMAMQHCGDADRVYELCLLNDVSLTDDIDIDTDIIVPDYDFDSGKIVKLLKDLGLAPASKVDALDEVLTIDYALDFVLRDDKVLETGLATVHNMQCFIDFAMQELGDVERVFELCMLNDLPLTEMLTQGSLIKVPPFAGDKKRLVTYLKTRTICSRDDDDSAGGTTLPPGGIGFMQVGYTFKSS